MGQVFVAVVKKDPEEILDYTEDWTDVLDPIEDQISNAAFSTSGDLQVWESQFTVSDTTIWLSGGTAGVKYAASVVVTTTAGRKFKRSIRVNCINR
jgi:hypothetical protein